MLFTICVTEITTKTHSIFKILSSFAIEHSIREEAGQMGPVEIFPDQFPAPCRIGFQVR